MNKIRRGLCLLLCGLCCLGPAALAEEVRIGMLIYNGTDTFMADVFARVLAAGEDTTAQLQLLDSKNSQTQQNDQVRQLLEAGVDALIINAVDRTSALYLIRMIQPYGVPVVFVNREPLYEDLLSYDKAYYVGNNPQVSGAMSGELLVEYFRAHPKADRNGDGVIQYVMLKGEPGHQDAELRTIYSVKALTDAGFAVEKLAEDVAMWERSIAQEKMAGYLSAYGDRIECVLANNDEMALGAIEALKAAGYFAEGHNMPVVGVDATSPGREAIREHTLLGTVLNDPQGLCDAALQLALLLAEGQSPTEENFPYSLDRERYVWTDSRKITLETLQEE